MAHFIGGRQQENPLRGLTRGITQGARLGLAFKESGRRDKEQESREKARESAVSMGKANIAFKALSQDIPPSMKLEIWNEQLMPELNKIFSQPGSKAGGQGFTKLEEWPDALNDCMKKANKLLDNKNLSESLKLDGLAALQVGCGKDINLAPLMERGEVAFKKKESAATLELKGILKGGLQENEKERYTTLMNQFPDAAINAAKILNAERKVAKPQKLPSTTDAQGNVIANLRLADGSVEKINLGKDFEEVKFNLGRWKTALSIRAAGGKVPKDFGNVATTVNNWTRIYATKVHANVAKLNWWDVQMAKRAESRGGEDQLRLLDFEKLPEEE